MRRATQDYNNQETEEEEEKKEIYTQVVVNPKKNESFGVQEARWSPIHMYYQWCNNQLRERINVIVLMPLSINDKHSIAVKKKVVNWRFKLSGQKCWLMGMSFTNLWIF